MGSQGSVCTGSREGFKAETETECCWQGGNRTSPEEKVGSEEGCE